MRKTHPSGAAIDYPSSDGRPMADNDWQRAAMLYAIGTLQVRYAHRRDVYVSGDLLMYYEEGNPRASVAPDVFVVFGAEARKRMVYKLWEEPKAPDFVLEVASPRTWADDEGPKAALYERLGVREYFQHDPMGGLLAQRLRGRRLGARGYEPQPVVESLDGTLMLRSHTLGLDLLAGRDGGLRFRDPATGRLLLGHYEAEAAYQQADAAYRVEAAARHEEAAARREAEAARRAAKARAAALERSSATIADDGAPPALAPGMTLDEVAMTPEEGAIQWPAQWMQQGREQGLARGLEQGRELGRDEGLEHERALLRRMTAARFGETAAERVLGTLTRIADPEPLAELGEWLVRCDTAEAFLDRVGALPAGPSPRAD